MRGSEEDPTQFNHHQSVLFAHMITISVAFLMIYFFQLGWRLLGQKPPECNELIPIKLNLHKLATVSCVAARRIPLSLIIINLYYLYTSSQLVSRL